MKIENAEQALVEILNKAVEVGDFMTEQAPLVVQELLAYKTVSHLATLVVLAIGSILLASVAKWSFREIKSEKHYDAGGYWILMCASGFFSSLMLLGAIDNLLQTVKVFVAPRVYLLEYAAELVRQA